MTRDEIIEKITTSNKHLNSVSKRYLIGHLDHPILGYHDFNDIEGFLKSELNEYRITNHQEHGHDYASKELQELLKQFCITEPTYEQFKESVNEILNSYTDHNKSKEEKRKILQRQIKHFTYGEADDSPLSKIYNKLIENGTNDKYTYLDNIIDMMNTLGINQIKDDKYIIIEKLFETYETFLHHLVGFREKKKYLQKLKEKGAISIPNNLHTYFKEIYDNEPNPEDGLKAIQWFYFYLMHGKAKLIAYLADSIFGSKDKNTLKFVQLLFLLDHTSGQSNDNFNFSHHNWIAEIHTAEYAEEPKYNPTYKEIIKKI